MSTISYLVTCSTETDSLKKLLKAISQSKLVTDEIVILMDSAFANESIETYNIVGAFHHVEGSRILSHSLNKDYGSHKNFGIENCSGDFIFQIDGDEMPPEALLGENIHSLIESNPTIEAYAVPRINAWVGLAPEHTNQWPLDISPTYKRLRAAWPDHQWRIFKRDYPRISFKRRLHEKIEGYDTFSFLPSEEEWALYHDKTIETQIATNIRYNEWFTYEENLGHTVLGENPIYAIYWNTNVDGDIPTENTSLSDNKNWNQIFLQMKKDWPDLKETDNLKVISCDKINPSFLGAKLNAWNNLNTTVPKNTTHIIKIKRIY